MRTRWLAALCLTLGLLITHATPTLAGFEGGDSPAMASASGNQHASGTAITATDVRANQGAAASDRANQATGIDSSGHPGDSRDRGGR